MKVKELLNKMQLSGDVREVTVHDTETGFFAFFFGEHLREGNYSDWGDLIVNSFTVKGEIMTIYAREGRKRK